MMTVIKKDTATLLQNRETWSIDQDVINNLADSFKASSSKGNLPVSVTSIKLAEVCKFFLRDAGY